MEQLVENAFLELLVKTLAKMDETDPEQRVNKNEMIVGDMRRLCVHAYICLPIYAETV